jgi:hypothetical protein
MFLYPERARKDRVLPKNKIYGNAQPSRAMRQRFVTEIDQIVWRYVLGTENLNLPARPGVEEIQVFEIALKTGQLKEDVLRTIDRAIPSLIFFELTFQGQVRFAAAYKRPPVSAAGESIAGPPVVEAYFEMPWQSSTAPRLPLPVAVDLGGLYEQMLRQHMLASPLGLHSRAGESLAQTVARGVQIRALRRECQRSETMLRKEIQFNRKVEINRELRRSQEELLTLERKSHPGTKMEDGG